MSLTLSSLSVEQRSSSSLSITTSRSSPPAPAEQPAGVPQEQVKLNQGSSEALTYDKPRTTATPPDIMAMLDESSRKADEMIGMIRSLLEQQGLKMGEVVSGRQQLNVDQATIDKAKEAIGEDGEFGVRKVSERILSFAKFAMQGDPANLDKIRDAVKLGFDQAKEVLGGELPEISKQTYDTIMAEFDRWEKEGLPEGDKVELPRKGKDGEGSAGGVSAA
ncbi:hypothetical protein [Chitinilyticum piscinae]|uniref:DUF5610 domain-containing protein n=1 Tax=Chitinilyticum piscinae TaxID=2866724 RepID=A0A8J7G1C7_9NEIS|nr:hypothetical protein [Chitinilyticum piscinae]MBE9610175.1 hypothetical protein [Chitinilyticum piscinae]